MSTKSPLPWSNGKVYLFQGTDYVRYDFESGALDQDALPVSSTSWPGLRETAPDAALSWGFGKIYFFYSDEYVRFDVGLNNVDPEYLPPNEPTKIAGRWPGFPDEWGSGIDAAVNWGNGKVYFFRGSEYLRYDITLDRVDPDYPKPIDGNWPGVWPSGIEGVLYQGGAKAYFFQGDEYLRYDLPSDRVDGSGLIAQLVLDPVPAGMWTAARDMTVEQANSVMGYLIENGKLTLSPTNTPYKGSWQTGITSPTPTTRVVIKPASINNISFTNDAGAAPLIDNVDQRMLVALYRLTLWVNASKPEIAVIRHLGIGHGSGPANDCHNQGRALDFSGIDGTLDGVSFNRKIQRDWGSLAVTAGLSLRLNPDSDLLAHDLFQTVFRFGTFECECNGIGKANKWPVKKIGDVGGFVIHPDYINGPNDNLRSHHQNHIHMQIGPTKI
jgi:Hemopexin